MDVIGVDAGGSWIKASRFSDALQSLSEVKVESGARRGVREYVESILKAIAECGGSPAAIGLSLPGVMSRDYQYLKYAANVKGLEVGGRGLSIQESFGEKLKLPVVAENDAKCAALGEWAQGKGGGKKDMSLLHLTWGTGIGTGFITHGKPQYGWEAGHVPVAWGEPSAVPCGCGSVIDLESRIAVPRLVVQTRELFDTGQYDTKLKKSDFKDPYEVPKLLSLYAREEDELSQIVLRQALEWMAKGLHTMAIIAYPQMVTIGGAMMDSDWLLEKLRLAIRKTAQGFLRDSLKPEVVHRAVLGNQAGKIGAAMLALQNIKSI